MQKKLLAILSVAGLLVSCSEPPSRSSSQNSSTSLSTLTSETSVPSAEEDARIREVYTLYLASGGTLSYEEWLKTVRGEAGTSLLTGNGAPAQNLGKDGDSYIDTLTWDFYVKTGGAWAKRGNIHGEKGADGQNGMDGKDGKDGADGQNGMDGKDGKDGADGQNGMDGKDGKSAYEIYIEAHPEYTGDEQQWLDDLANGRLGNQEKKTYTVTFDLGYNDLTFTQTVEEGKKASKPENPIRKFYNFVDWVDENNDHWVFNGFSITEDITLYAIWDCPYEFTVTFLNEDGSFLAEQKANAGDKVQYPLEGDPKPSKPDPHYIYAFKGWSGAPETITGDVTVTAQYDMAYISTTAYYYDYDGETLLATVPLAEGEAPHFDGEVPTKERDKANKIQFEFESWTKVEETPESISFVAKYASCTDGLDISGRSVIYYHGTSENVVIPSSWGGVAITAIQENAFDGNKTVKNVEIPDSVRSLGRSAFANCSNLVTITLPDSIWSIGDYCFSRCSALTSIKLPSMLSSISDWMFDYCSSLSEIILPESIQTIGGFAFQGCSSLSSVTFSNSLSSIGSCAFRYCTSLSSVVIPDSVQTIWGQAFAYCFSLSYAQVPGSVQKMERNVFTNWELLISCDAEYKPTTWDGAWCGEARVIWGYESTVEKDGCRYILSEIDGETEVFLASVSEETTSLTIPTEIDGVKVTGFRLNGNPTITSVTVPSQFKAIETNAFRNCTSLTTVVLSDKITAIGDQAFYNCYSIKTIIIPSSVVTIGSEALKTYTDYTRLYYGGTPSEWEGVSKADAEPDLYKPFFYSEEEPTEEGRFWHYVDGIPAVW